MKLYKLTEQNDTTYNNKCKWGKNITNIIPKNQRNKQLCTSGVFHAYKNLNLALLLNPIHANIYKPKLWEAKGNIKVADYGKIGTWELTTVKEIEIPIWYKNNRKNVQIAFAILCAKAVLYHWVQYSNSKCPQKAIEMAENYLKTINENNAVTNNIAASAAARAAHAASAAARAAHAASAARAAHAAHAASAARAAHAAHAASAAAYAAYAAYDASAAARAAYAASAAARAAHVAYAAHAASDAADDININFSKLANIAVSKYYNK